MEYFKTDNYEQLTDHCQASSHSLEALFLKHQPQHYIRNAHTETIVYCLQQQPILNSINYREYNNTHLCSPYTMYISYAHQAAHLVRQHSLRWAIHIAAFCMGLLSKIGKINQTVQIDNRFAAISLHHECLTAGIGPLTHDLKKQYPHHALFVPRLNYLTDRALLNTLQQQGYQLIPTKPVHLFTNSANIMKRNHVKRDQSLLRNSSYTLVKHDQFSRTDLKRLHHLYHLLFIKKHSIHNPDYTERYFIDCHRYRWYHFVGLRNTEGQIDGFISFRQYHGLMASGPLGYDTTKPKKLGLYRMLIALGLQQACQKKLLFNFGSGTEQFKLQRGSERILEYNAIYIQHLTAGRQLPWRLIKKLCQWTSVKLFRRHLL